MSPGDSYLFSILQKYAARDLTTHFAAILQLKKTLQSWAHTCFVAILDSGSRAKGTAISLASDVDYLVSLTSDCNQNSGGLKGIYESLYSTLSQNYSKPRKQNVSVRVTVDGLEVDVTPARKQGPLTNFQSLYVSKLDTWKQTNIAVHIKDISQSGRTNEIKILKVWRELNQLDFSSIYLEYLLVKHVLALKPKGPDHLADNVWYTLNQLAKRESNPLFARAVDPANTNNVLSDLLTVADKNAIIAGAQDALKRSNWNQIVW
jgi:hypothetical protein